MTADEVLGQTQVLSCWGGGSRSMQVDHTGTRRLPSRQRQAPAPRVVELWRSPFELVWEPAA